MKMKKVSSIILTAAIILTTACSENNTSSVNSQNSTVGNSSGGVTDNTTSSTVVENTPNKVDDTLPQCAPANLPSSVYDARNVMKGKDGYYYTSMLISGDKISNALHYYDLATGKSIPLCSKPQCIHDGNDFCAATGGFLYINGNGSADVLYNGYIYRLGDTAEEVDKYDLALFKVDLQGNELSKVSDILSVSLGDGVAEPAICSKVFHYGKMIIAAQFYDNVIGWSNQFYIVDISTGEKKEINIPEHKKGTRVEYETGISLVCDDDWLYYTARYVAYKGQVHTETNMTYDRTVMYRYNLKTGETEEISEMPDIYSSFTVNNNIIYYTVADRKDNTFSLYSLDTITRKIITLADKIQQNYVDGKYISHSNKVTVVTDRKYLYICTRGLTGYYRKDATNNEIQDDIDFYIYSLDGKELVHGLTGMEALLDMEKEWRYTFSAINGEIYFNYQDRAFDDSDSPEDTKSGMYTIKTEDLINGKTNWTKLYKAIN